MRLCVLGAVVIVGLVLGPQTAQAGQASAVSATAATTASPTKAATPAATPAKTPEAKSSVAAGATGNTANAFHPSVAHRSPVAATLFAWFPGIVIHGAGHMYAHSWMKGLGLFALEGASVYLLYDGYHEYQRGSFNNLLNNNNNSGGGIPTNLGYAYQELGIALVAVPAWWFTWIDDVCGASIAADQFNQIQQEQASTISMRLEPRPDGVVLALSSNF